MFTFFPFLTQLWFIGLLIAWAVFLFGGFLLGQESVTHRIPTRNRMASSIVLTVAGWSWLLVSWGEADIRPFALLIALGMSCGLIGDLILADILPGGRSVINGIVAFGVGHVLYIIAVLWLTDQRGAAGWLPLLLWLIVGAVGWWGVVFRGQERTILHWAALPYALLLASTAGVATRLALLDGDFAGLAVGAGLFLFSDLVLAGELFAGYRFRSVGDLIWLTYGPGQMLIVFAVAAAWA